MFYDYIIIIMMLLTLKQTLQYLTRICKKYFFFKYFLQILVLIKCRRVLVLNS